MAKQDDGLFLLEVLIDKIVFVKSPCFTDKDFRTCVKIDCPGMEPLEICDDELDPCAAKSGGPFVKTFNSGKSCLFSLKESEISNAMSSFPIKICVYKALPCGCLPAKIVMGEATIDMTKEFVQARNKFLEFPNTVSYQALKDSFRIMGPDGAESGEIVMFLRISCFGKLIITKFQGAGGPPTLGGPAGASINDRSCNPQRNFQSSDDPCVCGGARGMPGGGGGAGGAGGPCPGGGGGVCPIARDPYNSMPCVEGDDVCYCSGPKPEQKIPMACRNTDQYCLHVPKGALPSLPFYQEVTEEQKLRMKISTVVMKHFMDNYYNIPALDLLKLLNPPISDSIAQYLNELRGVTTSMQYLFEGFRSKDSLSITSINTLLVKELCKEDNRTSRLDRSTYGELKGYNSGHLFIENNTFGQKETAVYMTYLDDFRHRTSGTQATASINKCLQVNTNTSIGSYYPSSCNSNLDAPSLCNSVSTTAYRSNRNDVTNKMHYSEVYFWGRKKDDEGMGSSGCNECKDCKEKLSKKSSPLRSPTKCCGSQTRSVKGASASTGTGKSVCIKDDKPNKCCPAMAVSKGDISATVSHIRIGPKEPCPVHGCTPCQGPKCIVASSGEQQVPVKVSTVTNPRRGVFELVIRRMTGAPLAKNELMLEWTPPPVRPPCGSPCAPTPCSPPSPCRLSKCKMIVCRASPCKPKICRKGCKRPCRPVPCRPTPCKKCCKPCPPSPCRPCPPPKCGGCGSGCCSRCPSTWPCRPLPPWRYKVCSPYPCKPCPPSSCISCSSCKPCRPRSCPRPLPCCAPPPCRPFPPPPCRPCKPCPPSPCRPCKPPSPFKSPCPSQCCKKPCCASPCRSSPCIHPCRRRKHPRKCRSSPKIKARRKRISPCCNRTKQCPVVRCRSLPGPCVMCCSVPRCPPRKCCSVAPCKSPC
ncbi:uncharacterized protein LOC106133750 [Amyelois transitella]|uniref:uncharacterized protein LOC106133750 n=1 Tax=Amyelois transitella TaxID=680683 RepID=UPI00298FD9AF|nr:uncharacterized protein LOC106133750 [Amyelois transitella]